MCPVYQGICVSGCPDEKRFYSILEMEVITLLTSCVRSREMLCLITDSHSSSWPRLCSSQCKVTFELSSQLITWNVFGLKRTKLVTLQSASLITTSTVYVYIPDHGSVVCIWRDCGHLEKNRRDRNPVVLTLHPLCTVWLWLEESVYCKVLYIAISSVLQCCMHGIGNSICIHTIFVSEWCYCECHKLSSCLQHLNLQEDKHIHSREKVLVSSTALTASSCVLPQIAVPFTWQEKDRFWVHMVIHITHSATL